VAGRSGRKLEGEKKGKILNSEGNWGLGSVQPVGAKGKNEAKESAGRKEETVKVAPPWSGRAKNGRWWGGDQ